MKQRMINSLLLLAAVFLFGGCVDQRQGSNVENSGIVATSVTVCEILDALEVENVIGIPTTDTYEVPERYADAAEVGGAMAPDMEILAQLNPQWVFSPMSLETDLASQYENLGLNAGFLNLTSVPGLYKSIQDLGALLGQEAKAAELVDEFLAYIEAYGERNQGKESPRILLLMGLPGSYVVATEYSYAGSLIELAGGTNVYAGESGESFINVNAEDMLQRDPDIILLTSHAMPESVEAMFEKEFVENDVWQHFGAVQENQVYTLDNQKFGMSANFSYREALEDLQVLLYGE